jgi:3-deoxy-manno-octulosonate cytidylyltransferase (CMP-KDO synthetase)
MDATVVGVIPARLASTRLPRKVLRTLAGRPMLAWVHDAARAAAGLDQVIIATDSEEIVDLAESRGWTAMLTSPSLPSGSDRVHAVAQSVPADIYVNIQGDEPLLRPEHVEALLAPFGRSDADTVEVTTLATECPAEEIHNPNTVKVVTTEAGRALYFSRAAIPYDREGTGAMPVRKHIGLYAYRRAALGRFAQLAPSPLERVERLEQLRLLENGMGIYVENTPFDTVGVDTEADLMRAEEWLRRRA